MRTTSNIEGWIYAATILASLALTPNSYAADAETETDLSPVTVIERTTSSSDIDDPENSNKHKRLKSVFTRNGLHLGPLTFHFTLDVGNNYVYNPNRNPGASQGINFRVVEDLRTTVSFNTTTAYAYKKFNTTLAGGVSYNHYWGLKDPTTKNLSATTGHANLGMVYALKGVTFSMYGGFQRMVPPRLQVLGQRLGVNTVNTGTSVSFLPGGGALSITADYMFGFTTFDSVSTSAINSTNIFDNITHIPSLRIQWRFLPKTALYSINRLTIRTFNNTRDLIRADGTPVIGSATGKNAYLFLSELGVTGSLTKRIAVTVGAGYNAMIANEATGTSHGGVARFNLNYVVPKKFSTGIGLSYGMASVPLFNLMHSTGIGVSYSQILWKKLSVGTGLGFSYNQYAAVVPDIFAGKRRDLSYNWTTSVGYSPLKWISLSINNMLIYLDTNYTLPTGIGPDPNARRSTGYLANNFMFQIQMTY